jgi:hypothetical protein
MNRLMNRVKLDQTAQSQSYSFLLEGAVILSEQEATGG